jgi:1-acyl-sn-glycerol-3-phosphate acyltransferase
MKYFLRWLIRVIFNLIARVELTGYEHLPKEGSYLIATNHLGIVDAPMAFYALDNWDMFLMVAEKWEDVAFFRWLGRYFNFIFIDRYNPDITTMRKVIRLMEEDNILVIAPEGTRSRTGALIEARPGVSYLATKLNRPIVPVALTGTEDEVLFGNLKRFKRTRMTVTGGPAFTLPPLPKEGRDEALKKYTDEIMCRIAVLLPEKYHGVYAGHPRLKELSNSTAKDGN